MNRRGLWLIVPGIAAAALVAGCTREPAEDTPVSPAQSDSSALPSGPQPAKGPVHATVHVVDLDGNPLAGMLPVATQQPNAFDTPLAKGYPSNAEGVGVLSLLRLEHVCVRAWDPAQRYFANNYYDVFPAGESGTLGEMTITMVPAATLSVILIAPDGAPAANENVGLMMFHPTRGPWWPSETDTEASGRAVFAPVPAGQYTIKLKALVSGRLDVPEVSLTPGGHTDLGVVQLAAP